jgi:hypothetical protein
MEVAGKNCKPWPYEASVDYIIWTLVPKENVGCPFAALRRGGRFDKRYPVDLQRAHAPGRYILLHKKLLLTIQEGQKRMGHIPWTYFQVCQSALAYDGEIAWSIHSPGVIDFPFNEMYTQGAEPFTFVLDFFPFKNLTSFLEKGKTPQILHREWWECHPPRPEASKLDIKYLTDVLVETFKEKVKIHFKEKSQVKKTKLTLQKKSIAIVDEYTPKKKPSTKPFQNLFAQRMSSSDLFRNCSMEDETPSSPQIFQKKEDLFNRIDIFSMISLDSIINGMEETFKKLHGDKE